MAGPFVYTGSGRKVSENAEECVKKCKKQACLIQMCLGGSLFIIIIYSANARSYNHTYDYYLTIISSFRTVARNGSDEARCVDIIKSWKDCCENAKQNLLTLNEKKP